MTTRTTPYTDLELEWILEDADTRQQQVDILRDHIDRGGMVRASIILKATSCEDVEQVKALIVEVQRKE